MPLALHMGMCTPNQPKAQSYTPPRAAGCSSLSHSNDEWRGDAGGVWWCPAGDPAKRSFQSEGTHTAIHTPQRDECAVLGASGVVRVPTTTMANCGGCGVVMVACSSPVRPHKWTICNRWPVSIAVMAPVSSMLKIHAQECHWHRHRRVHTQSTKSTVLDTP